MNTVGIFSHSCPNISTNRPEKCTVDRHDRMSLAIQLVCIHVVQRSAVLADTAIRHKSHSENTTSECEIISYCCLQSMQSQTIVAFLYCYELLVFDQDIHITQ